VYDRAGTVAEFLAQQDVADFVAAADRYLAILQKLYSAWRQAPEMPDAGETVPAASDDEMPDPMDLDRAVANFCATCGIAEPTDIEERMRLHIEAITRWLEKQSGGRAPPQSEESEAPQANPQDGS
jgi:hypothetical protein